MAKAPQPASSPSGNRSNAFLYVLIAAGVSFAIIPTIVVLSVAMMPTGVAFLIERGKGYYAGVTVGALNLAGAAPYLTDLWVKNHTVDGAIDIITNVWAYMIMYSAALFGWAVYSTMPAVVGSFIAMTAGRRIQALRDQQKELVQKWGPDVETVYEAEQKEKASMAKAKAKAKAKANTIAAAAEASRA
ncbi:MAG: hypothetical protein EXR11_11640 [Rhodospirillaceae bacterium]|nr:hypothetical protein [Rhodospirillaceae bacterium]